MVRQAAAGVDLSTRELLQLSAIHEAVLHCQGERKRQRLKRMLTEMGDTQRYLYDIFTLDNDVPKCSLPAPRY